MQGLPDYDQCLIFGTSVAALSRPESSSILAYGTSLACEETSLL